MAAICAFIRAATNTMPVTEPVIIADTATLIIAATIGRTTVTTERAHQTHRIAPVSLEGGRFSAALKLAADARVVSYHQPNVRNWLVSRHCGWRDAGYAQGR